MYIFQQNSYILISCKILVFPKVSIGLINGLATRIIWPPKRWTKIERNVKEDRLPIKTFANRTLRRFDTDEDENSSTNDNIYKINPENSLIKNKQSGRKITELQTSDDIIAKSTDSEGGDLINKIDEINCTTRDRSNVTSSIDKDSVPFCAIEDHVGQVIVKEEPEE